MKRSNIFILIGVMGLAVSCAHKKKTDAPAQKQEQTQTQEKAKSDKVATGDRIYSCKVGSDTRMVRFNKRASNEKSNRCEIHYTKFGAENQVAWAEATPSICDRVYNQIRDNIEAKGFSCEETASSALKESEKTAKNSL